MNGCIGWVPSALAGYWSALSPTGGQPGDSTGSPHGPSSKGKAGHGAGGQAYDLLGLLHRQAAAAQTSAAAAFGVSASRAYPGFPPPPHPHGYGYVLSYAHAHRPFSPPTSASGSGLAPLQKLCSSDSSAFKSLEEGRGSGTATPERGGAKSLKFGISRILDDDFGKNKHEKGEWRVEGVSEQELRVCKKVICLTLFLVCPFLTECL